MKTPEEMAEEFSNWFVGERRKTIAKKSWYTGFEEGLKAAKDSASIDTNSIDTGTKMQWISVKDRLPEFCKTVVAYGPHIYCVISQLMQDEEGYSYVGPYMSVHPNEVTHWCEVPELPELPEAPKEEK